MNNDKVMKFKCSIKRERYSSENYKIYVVDVDKKIYKDLPQNKNNEYILVGDMQSLLPNSEYDIAAKIEVNKNFGVQYKVLSATKDKPTDLESSRKFLYEITSRDNADTLLSVYPDIIDKIIKNDLADINLNKTKGIKDATFNGIKSKVIDNFALIEVVNYFEGLIPLNIVKKMYDEYNSVHTIKKEMNKNPYKCLCKLSRISFTNADKTLVKLDEISREKEGCKFSFSEKLLISKQRMKASIDFVLEENELSGNTRMDIKALRSKCNELTPECIEHFVSLIKENGEDIFVHNESKTISSAKAYKTEKYICEVLKLMLNNSIRWNINTELYRDDNGFSLTDEQLNTLDNVCKYNISILTAPAGSGKTASVKNLLTMLDAYDKKYMLCSPTGKASEVLSEQTGRDAGTIHRKLEYNPSNEKNPWTYNEHNKLKVDVVVVDEFSMVDIYLFKHLLDAIDFNKTKLLLVFDSYQLASVGCGNIAHDLIMSKVIPTTVLTKIFRYAEGGLMQVVTKIRNSENFLDNDFSGVQIFGSKKDFVYVETQQQYLINQVLKIYSKLLKDGYTIEDIMVLACQNKGEYGTKGINKAIQYTMQKGKNNKFLMRGEDKFFKGDKIIQTVNNYKAEIPEYMKSKKNKSNLNFQEDDETTEVFNGNTGVIIDVTFNDMVVDFGKGKYVVYKKGELDEIELGYCISKHRSQGSQSKQIICVAPKAHTFMLNSNLLYVAGTRAKERVYMIGNIITINRAIKKKENLQRNTWLTEMLTDKIS